VRSFNTTIGAFDARALGLGGWTLAQHHFYDSGGRVLHLGTGGRRGADSVHLIINTAAGGGPTSGNNGDGGPASKATPLDRPGGIAVGPDGSVYIAEFGVDRVRKIGPDGIITTVAGTGQNGFSGDGGAATLAKLSQPRGLAVGPDGALYIADSGNLRIRRVGVDGVINTVAGNGTFGFSGDGGPATQASFVNVSSISLGPDGSIYIADHSSDFGSRVRRVAPDGTVNTFAGNGTRGSSGDEGPATQATISPVAVAVAPDGSLYIAEESSSGRVRRVAPDGVIKTVAGNGIPSCFCDDSGQGDGGPATQVSLTPSALALAPDGYSVHR
jgi:sugar lactone lactonase YvrE